MDSSDVRNLRKDEQDSQEVDSAAVAEERPRPQGDAPQAASGGAADPGCLSNTQGNTQGHSSLLQMEGYPDYHISGGIDWFEWWSLVHWEYSDRFQRAIEILQAAKQACQAKQKPFVEVLLPDFGPVRVRRMGFNRGGERGQHLELRLQIPGMTVGLSPRNIPPHLDGRALRKAQPNFAVQQTGRDCLLVGALEGYEMADALLRRLAVRRSSSGSVEAICVSTLSISTWPICWRW